MQYMMVTEVPLLLDVTEWYFVFHRFPELHYLYTHTHTHTHGFVNKVGLMVRIVYLVPRACF
jgi:hypothetical protein